MLRFKSGPAVASDFSGSEPCLVLDFDNGDLYSIDSSGNVVQVNGGSGPSGVDTANSPGAGEWAKFTDADTIEGRTAAELKADLDLEVGTDFPALSHTHAWADVTGEPTTLAGYGITDAQPLDADLTAIAALTTTAHGRGLLDDVDAAASRTSIGAHPIPTGTPDGTKYLRDDNSWQAVAGGSGLTQPQVMARSLGC